MLTYIDGHVINLDQVRYIEPLRKDGNQPRMRIHFDVDEALTVDYDFWSLHKFTEHVVPALPGYFVIEAYEPDATDSSEWEFVETPIIAFRIDGKEDPVAITFEGEVEGGIYVIVAPNGRAFNSVQRYASAQEWKDLIVGKSKPSVTVPEP